MKFKFVCAVILTLSAVHSHAGWMFITKDTVDNQGTDEGSALQSWIQEQKGLDANVNLIAYGDVDEQTVGNTLTLDPGTENLTLHYGNYDGQNNVTLLYMCDGQNCDSFTLPTTKALSNYRAYGTAGVPEPGSLGLMGAVIALAAGMVFLRRRQLRSQG